MFVYIGVFCNFMGFQPLKYLILLHCCYNEFVKFPKIRVFKKQTFELAERLETKEKAGIFSLLFVLVMQRLQLTNNIINKMTSHYFVLLNFIRAASTSNLEENVVFASLGLASILSKTPFSRI